jgi:hypothetical protein
MRAHLKRLSSPDVADLRIFRPRDPANFAIVMDAKIGVEGLDEGENFRMLLCTPVWLMENHAPADVVVGHQLLIVFRYDFEAIVRHLVEFCRRCEGDDWYAITRQLHALGRWEFEQAPAAG